MCPTLKAQSIMVEKSQLQDREGAEHILSDITKQKADREWSPAIKPQVLPLVIHFFQ